MVKMNIHSESEDPQISRLNEFFFVVNRIRKVGRNVRQGLGKFKSKPNPSGSGAWLPTPTSSEDLPSTNGSITPPVQRSHVTSSTPSSPLPGSLLSKEERSAIRTPEVSAALSSPVRCPCPNKIAQVISERSDGGAREGHPQRSPLTIFLSDVPTRATTSVAEAAGKSLLV
jgi:hypothetical protein